jgi:hypothetical protein
LEKIKHAEHEKDEDADVAAASRQPAGAAKCPEKAIVKVVKEQLAKG